MAMWKHATLGRCMYLEGREMEVEAVENRYRRTNEE
jgi:hypothetical protein